MGSALPWSGVSIGSPLEQSLELGSQRQPPAPCDFSEKTRKPSLTTPRHPDFNEKVKGIFISFKWNESFLGPERIIYQVLAALCSPLQGPAALRGPTDIFPPESCL